MNPFVERHRDRIAGVLSCFDHVVVTETLPDIGRVQAMAGFGGRSDRITLGATMRARAPVCRPPNRPFAARRKYRER